MTAEIAEPSVTRRRAWTDVEPHPWRRFCARTLDTMIVGSATTFTLSFIGAVIAPSTAQQALGLLNGPFGTLLETVATYLLAIPGNALIIGLTGGSIGKWIFGVRVLKDGRPIGLTAAFDREFEIWWHGLACGVPLISLWTLSESSKTLEEDGTTPWDERQENVVTHRPQSLGAGIMMWAVGLGGLALMILGKLAAVVATMNS